jgi:hypothetical protein
MKQLRIAGKTMAQPSRTTRLRAIGRFRDTRMERRVGDLE